MQPKMWDFLWIRENEEMSDAQLMLVEEDEGARAAAEAAPKRARVSKPPSSSSGSSDGSSLVLPINRTVVMSACEFLKAGLGSWQRGGEPCRAVLNVPRGQLEVGRRFVLAMYEPEPSFADLNDEQRVQLLLLADRYGAPGVASAAAAAVGLSGDAMFKRGLEWAAVQAAYPPLCSQPQTVAPPALRQFANDALQRLFGDLEAVWASPARLRKEADLLALSPAALKALLADERTRVASENTVVHTIERFVAERYLLLDSAPVKQLLALVRAARLTPNYARTVFAESALAKKHLRDSELKLAAMAPSIGDRGMNGIDASPCAWWLPPRPRSALPDTLPLEWALPLGTLKARVRALVAATSPGVGGSKSLLGPEGVVWQGWPLRLQLDCVRSSSGAGLELGLRLVTLPPCRGAVASIQWRVKAVATSGRSVTTDFAWCLYTAAMPSFVDYFIGRGAPVGSSGGGGAGPCKDWADVEAALHAARLVHGDGGAAHLKLRCEVKKLE